MLMMLKKYENTAKNILHSYIYREKDINFKFSFRGLYSSVAYFGFRDKTEC